MLGAALVSTVAGRLLATNPRGWDPARGPLVLVRPRSHRRGTDRLTHPYPSQTRAADHFLPLVSPGRTQLLAAGHERRRADRLTGHRRVASAAGETIDIAAAVSRAGGRNGSERRRARGWRAARGMWIPAGQTAPFLSLASLASPCWRGPP